MQILKDEIKYAIMDAAMNEFYEAGYEEASIRLIAKRAGISVGNFYRYYKSKDEVFYELLAPVVSEIVSLIERQDDENGEMTFDHLKCHMENQVIRINEVIKRRKKEIMILLEGSQGTRYENVKEIFIESLQRHICAHINAVEISIPKELARVQAVSIVEGYLEIIKKYYDDPLFDELLKKYFAIQFGGWKMMFNV